MVESQSLYEWSSEVAIALSLRFCSWVVAEDLNEDLVTVKDEVDYDARSHSPVATITEEESC